MLLSILILATSCEDFLDVNDNPNDPTISTPSLTLPVAQQSFVALNSRSMNYLGNFMNYHWGVPSNWSAQANLIRYNVTTEFYANIFETSYSSIFKNLQYISTYEDGSTDYTAYKVIAGAIKGFQYQYLVDLYGDVPFSEANLRGDNPTPVYDDAETIYKAIIAELTATAELAINISTDAQDPGAQDIIFHGDMGKWAQFANTVKLRMLIRMSNTGQDSYITSEIATINANGAGYISENVFANPGYSDDADKQNPFYAYLGTAPGTSSITDRNDYTIATDYIINALTTTGDIRLEYLYSETANGGYKGAEQTTTLPGTGFTTEDLSHVGPGLLIDSEQDQPVILYTESLLLQAEAMVRGYIAGGEAGAKDLYEAAIEESFIFLGVDDAVAEAQTYYNQPIINVRWANSPNKIEAIITQKSIALNGTHAIESWIELTRTGYPLNVPVPAESDGVRPVTLLYPDTEVARNTENVPSQTKGDAFTQNPFWK